MNATVIYSKTLRKLKNSSQSFRKEIREKLQSANIKIENFILEGEEIKTKYRDLSESDFDFIVAAGGDGTISSIASVLIGKDIPLGVVPLGTFNHFAKDMNLPLNIDDALNVIINGKVQKIDAGKVNEHYFINNSSIGLYPRMVRHRKADQKRLGGNKWLAENFLQKAGQRMDKTPGLNVLRHPGRLFNFFLYFRRSIS